MNDGFRRLRAILLGASACVLVSGPKLAGQALGEPCGFEVGGSPVVVLRNPEFGDARFHAVTGGLLMPGGRIAIADGGSRRVLLYRDTGLLDRTFGGDGDGPMEFRALAGLWRADDSTLLVSDPVRSRVTYLDVGLRSSRSHAVPSGSGIRWPRVIGDAGRHVVAINGQSFERGQLGTGVIRVPYEFLRFARGGAPVDTLHAEPGAEFFVPASGDPFGTQRVPFGVELLFAVRDSSLLLLRTDGGSLRSVGPDGRVRAFAELPLTRSPVTRAAVEAYRDERERSARSAAERRAAALLREIAFPLEFPSADALLVDAEGSSWVRRFRFGDHVADEWLVVSGDGTQVCTATVASTLRVLDATRDRLLALRTDDDGLQQVLVLQLTRR